MGPKLGLYTDKLSQAFVLATSCLHPLPISPATLMTTTITFELDDEQAQYLH